jgi:thioredoxin-like negative regulator of GroEL
VICPKCGLEQPDGVDCRRCGVLVAKYRPRPRGEPLPPGSRRAIPGASLAIPAAPAAMGGRGKAARFGRDLLIVSGLLAVSWWWTSGRSSPPGDAPPVRSSGRSAASEPPAQPPPVAQRVDARAFESGLVPAPELALPAVTCPLEDHGLSAPSPAENVSPTWYRRAAEYERALAEQQSTGRPLVVYVYTDWCPHCRDFDRELLSAIVVDRYLVEHAVKVRINPESGPDEDGLAQRLGADSYPTFMAAVPGGQPVPLSLRERGEFMRPERFVDQIEGRMADWAAAVIAAAPSERRARRRPPGSIALLLTHALAVRPDAPQGYLERARVLAADHRLDAALDDLARVDQANPGQVTTYQAVDELLAQENRWDEVIACWSRMLEHPGGHGAEAHLARSRALERRGLGELARADAEQACQLGAQEGCSATARLPPPPAAAGPDVPGERASP